MTPSLSSQRRKWPPKLYLCLVVPALILILSASQLRAQPPQELPELVVPGQRPKAPEPTPPPPPTPAPPPRAEVSGRTDPVTNTFGSPQSASQGLFTQADIRNKPLFRPTAFLEQIPGLILTQESGGVDADVVFLRGFNLEHGTDFAFFFDGIPLNLVSDPHGQGFADLQFVIPELISTVDFGKGPYYAKVGNFSTVGYANIQYFDALPYGFAKVEAGKWDWFRTVVADSGQVGPGVLLFGVQFNSANGFYQVNENMSKTSAVFRYTIADESDKLTLSAILYNGQGTVTTVVPQRLVHAGFIDRFANLSPTDFTVVDRFMVNGQWQHRWDNGALTQGNVYGYRYSFSIIENAGGFLDDPVNGDQSKQTDKRWVTGVNFSHTWDSRLFGDRAQNTIGAQVRHDDIPTADTFHTANRGLILSTDGAASIRETDTGLYYQNEFKWLEKVRTVLGLRGDFYSVAVANKLAPVNSGEKSSAIFLPKGALVLGPWASTEFFLNGGYTFRSNTAGGTVVSIDPATGEPVIRAPLLVQGRGAEVGFRSQAIPNLTTGAALWQLHLGSELQFDVVAQTTAPLRESDRYGIEWTNTYNLLSWLTLNADYSWSNGHLLGTDPDVPGNHIPQAVTSVFSGGPSVRLPNGLFANLRYRYWGPRYLTSDASASSRATNLFELSTGYECPRYTLNLQILNLFNNNGHDFDAFEETFYPNLGDAGPVDDILFKPLMPFAARFSVTVRW